MSPIRHLKGTYSRFSLSLGAKEGVNGENTAASVPWSKSVVTLFPSSTGLRSPYAGGSLPSGKLPESVENAFATTLPNQNQTNPRHGNDDEKRHKQWITDLTNWHDAHEKALASATLSRNRKSRLKRPREVPPLPNLVLPPPKIQAQLASTATSQAQIPIEQAQWSLLVDLEAGQACKRIRELKRKSRSKPSVEGEEQSHNNNATTIRPWRLLRRATNITVQGDYRTNRCTSSMMEEPTMYSSNKTVLQSTWKAVLAYAKEYQQRFSVGPPFHVSTILALVENSNKLVPPERVWDQGDLIVEEIHATLDGLVEPVQNARKTRAQWMDLWYKEGIELDVLRKSLKVAESMMVRPDEYEELIRQVKVVSEWQSRVDAVRTSPRSAQNDLEVFEELVKEADRLHGFRSKGLVELKGRLQRAYDLGDKILAWKKTIAERQKGPDNASILPPLESTKFLAGLVREISRLKLKFPAACFVLEVSEVTEAWSERANIAIRSRISLTEIRSLIERGHDIPVELTEQLEKLKARESKAQEWLDRLGEFVNVPDPEAMAPLAWMKVIRTKIGEGGTSVTLMHDLACEGNRIPVEMDCVKLLQIELDARNWSVKARSWIPSANGAGGDSCKKGKLEELREHMEKANLLRSRLVLASEEKDVWILDAEPELQTVLNQVDEWFDQYREFVEGDSRRGCRPEVPIAVLRESVEKAGAIFVNLGPASLKISKILGQAEKWYAKHGELVEKCQIERRGKDKVSLDSLKEAVQDAEAGIGVLDLKEANELEDLLKRIESWFERSNVAIGGKKLRGKQKLVFDEGDLTELVREGTELPIDVSAQLAQLDSAVTSLAEWKARVAKDIHVIACSFQSLREAVNRKYGTPEAFSPTYEDINKPRGGENELQEEKKQPDLQPLSAPSNDNDLQVESSDSLELPSSSEDLIKQICQDAKTSCMVSDEGKVVLPLEEVSRWTARSLKYVESPREIFDGRFFGAFDRFLSEGKSLLETTILSTECPVREASLNWRSMMEDQMTRLNILMKERGDFATWCERVEEVLSGNDKKLTIEKLRELLRQSSRFPADSDSVVRVQELAQKCDSWVRTASEALQAEDKLPLHEAKALLEEGNRLGVLSNELRTLRNGVKTARTWANKVKKCKPDQAQTQFKIVKSLLDEYDNLIVSLPEEYKRLCYGLKNYCICRRPYEGFMIKCEKCEDWFHGPCVGVSQARAEKKSDKYVCVRCLVAKVFHTSSTNIAAILRKWTSEADLKKARMADAQKHQRKIRKETKDLEKLRAEAEQINQMLSNPKPEVVPVASAESTVVEPTNTDGVVPREELSNEGATPPTVPPTPTAPVNETKTPPEPIAPQDIQQRIEKISAAIKLCQSKLQDLADSSVRQRNEEEIENVKADVLKKWCIRVRSLIIAPSTDELSLASRPPVNGTLSPPMAMLMQEAAKLGLTRYVDVQTVFNSLKCLCWSSHTMHVLANRPKACDAVASVRNASLIKLPDEKGLRMIKAMAQRATAWNFKASRLLTPVPGEKRPYDMKELRNLADIADDIPLRMPFEPRVQAVIDDTGTRHCVCGGPSDGRLMLGCDKCENWFHATCVGVKEEDSDQIDEWICPLCRGESVDVSQDALRGFHEAFGREDEEETLNADDDDESSKAPRIEKLWPPFGLLGSSECVSALGEHLCCLPSDTGHCQTITLPTVPSTGPGFRTGPPNQLCIANVDTVERPIKLPAETPSHDVAQVVKAQTACSVGNKASPQSVPEADVPEKGSKTVAETTQLPNPNASQTIAVGHAFGRQGDCFAEKNDATGNGATFHVPSMIGLQNGQVSMSAGHKSNEDGLLEPVAQLLAIKDVLVAPVKDT